MATTDGKHLEALVAFVEKTLLPEGFAVTSWLMAGYHIRLAYRDDTTEMARILVGTASWTDKTLIASGRFYRPEDNTPEGRLRHYASQFPLVEVDSSYYAIPEPLAGGQLRLRTRGAA
jgi:hypothetical protein